MRCKCCLWTENKVKGINILSTDTIFFLFSLKYFVIGYCESEMTGNKYNFSLS